MPKSKTRGSRKEHRDRVRRRSIHNKNEFNRKWNNKKREIQAMIEANMTIESTLTEEEE